MQQISSNSLGEFDDHHQWIPRYFLILLSNIVKSSLPCRRAIFLVVTVQKSMLQCSLPCRKAVYRSAYRAVYLAVYIAVYRAAHQSTVQCTVHHISLPCSLPCRISSRRACAFRTTVIYIYIYNTYNNF